MSRVEKIAKNNDLQSHVNTFFGLKKAELCRDVTSIARITSENKPVVIKQISNKYTERISPLFRQRYMKC